MQNNETKKTYDNSYHPYRGNPNNNGNNRPNSTRYNSYNNNQNRRDKYKILNDSCAQFNIHPYSIYDQPFPKFQQPVEIGCIISESRLF